MFRYLGASKFPLIPVVNLSTQLNKLHFYYRLGNQYLEDSALRSYLELFLPKDILESMAPELIHWGDRCVGGTENDNSIMFCTYCRNYKKSNI
jgi:hypothetical protein